MLRAHLQGDPNASRLMLSITTRAFDPISSNDTWCRVYTGPCEANYVAVYTPLHSLIWLCRVGYGNRYSDNTSVIKRCVSDSAFVLGAIDAVYVCVYYMYNNSAANVVCISGMGRCSL